MAQLKDIFLSIPRETLVTLAKYKLIRPTLVEWYDLIQFFDSIDFSHQAQQRLRSKLFKPISQMEKYIITGEQFNISHEQTRKVVSRLNRYI